MLVDCVPGSESSQSIFSIPSSFAGKKTERKGVEREWKKCKWLGGKPVNCHLPEEIRCEWIWNKTIFESVSTPSFFTFRYLLNATGQSVKNQAWKSIL